MAESYADYAIVVILMAVAASSMWVGAHLVRPTGHRGGAAVIMAGFALGLIDILLSFFVSDVLAFATSTAVVGVVFMSVLKAVSRVPAME